MPGRRDHTLYRCKLCSVVFITETACVNHKNDSSHQERKRSLTGHDHGPKVEPAAAPAPEFAVPCSLCKTPFNPDDVEDARTHIRSHVATMQGGHQCTECKIDFTHANELEMHKLSVTKNGNCGIAFDHQHPCEGHHPPSDRACGQVDRDNFTANLKKWEAQQVSLFRQSVVQLMIAVQASAERRKAQEAEAAAAAAAAAALAAEEERRRAEEAARQQGSAALQQAVASWIAQCERAGYSRQQIAALLKRRA